MARTRARRPKPQLFVLVVEDEPDLRVLAESNIADLGYETLSAANGREALALLNENQRITLLFTDINMPDVPDGIDGLELARRAVELRPGLRVIYTTAAGGLTDGMAALFVDGATFLPKPYTRDQLMRAMRGDPEPADQ
jgi:CheY-like chemotaxis protein